MEQLDAGAGVLWVCARAGICCSMSAHTPSLTLRTTVSVAACHCAWQAALHEPQLATQTTKLGSEPHRLKVRMWQGLTGAAAFLASPRQREAAAGAVQGERVCMVRHAACGLSLNSARVSTPAMRALLLRQAVGSHRCCCCCAARRRPAARAGARQPCLCQAVPRDGRRLSAAAASRPAGAAVAASAAGH